MKRDGENLIFSTGRIIGGNRGIFGFDPETGELTDGYDGTIEEAGTYSPEDRRTFSLGERRELAEFMAREWKAWGEK